jgi:hypothetical protein
LEKRKMVKLWYTTHHDLKWCHNHSSFCIEYIKHKFEFSPLLLLLLSVLTC